MTFMTGYYSMQEALSKLAAAKDRVGSNAAELGVDTCQKCSICCWQRPGCLNRKDVERLSRFYAMTPTEFFNEYLVVDELFSSYVVLPIRSSQKDLAGEYVPDDRTYDMDAPCIFLDNDNGLCKIHDIQPSGCRGVGCIREDDGSKYVEKYEWDKSDIMAFLGWDGFK